MRRVLVVAVAVGALASCSTFDSDFVAKVNGDELDEDDVEEMLSSPVASDVFSMTVLENGTVRSSEVRELITAWAALKAIDDAGIVDQEFKDQARADFVAEFGEGWDRTPAEMQELAVLNGVVGAMRIQARDEGRELEFVTQLQEIVQSADITVSSHYGRWDAEVFSVIPLG